ncbi:MAG TPA: 50S ribosomal protein L17 [Bacteroidia bacterium]|jgi:large subunit ribosomal protein L17|nr:50S ribosomal protein L17 [Bacteroidia bacterium]
MRHGNKVNHLGRTTAHRAALLSNLASSLIIHKRINTTLAKAKELRRYVEPLITRSKPAATKVEDMNNRRHVFSYLENKQAVAELFKEVGPKVANRAGGYTRIIRYSISSSPKPTARKRDDNADMCFIELVDYNEAMLAIKAEGKKPKTTRRSRGKAKKTNESSSEESKSE